jgi:predicted glutamine amidotransferase
MCRLLAISSSRAITVSQALGNKATEEFSALSEFHNDGWGAAWVSEEQQLRKVTSTKQADTDPAFARYLSHHAAKQQLVHLRWASKGMPNTAYNTHPFVEEGFAFEHNGNIAPAEDLERLLQHQFLATLRGNTDSERYFALIRQCCSACGSIRQGVINAVEMLEEAYPHRSLNAFLMHGDCIYIINVHEGASFSLDGYPDREEAPLPYQHTPEHYHDLMLQRTSQAVVVASSGIRSGAWEKIPEGSIVVIEQGQQVPTVTTIWNRQ